MSSNYDALSLQWLKWCLDFPRDKVKVIVSMNEVGPISKSFRSWNPEPKSVKLGPLEITDKVFFILFFS